MDRNPDRADELVGRILDGRYRVGPKIARGGMATVYEATDLRLERTVAIKVMHMALADDDEFVRRFQREARSAARLSHHNVVSVFDTGDDHGTLYLVMEYVPGLTLRDAIRKEAPMSPLKALTMIEPVLGALSAAHHAGILHRDVKPENVLIADDGRVKVADFGLSRAINSETQHTATGGVLIGTVSYLSPELVVNGKADARADVYAAGVLIYEMLTGTKPHVADSPIQVAYKHVHEDVPAPSRVVNTLPAYVDALVARATARDAGLRPADAGVLLHQVRRVRNALEQGVSTDPELEEDLTPSRSFAMEGTLPDAIIDPHDFDPVADRARDQALDQGLEAVFDYEQTEVTNRLPMSGHVPGQSPGPVPAREPERAVASAQRPSRRGPVMLVTLLLLAGLVGYAGWYLGMGRYQQTPSVLNLTQQQAATKLKAQGLKFSVVKRAYDEEVAAGRVLSTDPKPNERILNEATVKAVVSLGPERHAVPDLVNKSLEEATGLIEQATLTLASSKEKYDDVVPQGQVISSDPAAGTQLKRGDAVTLTVSKGKKPIDIPDFTGKPWTQAQQRLTKLGFTLQQTEDFSTTVPKGSVVSQSPKTGQGFKADVITVVVSKGPQMAQVPSVVGSGLDAAKQALSDAGFQVAVEHSSVYVGLSYVVGQSPSGGSMAPVGSTITLSIV